jgi:TPP-dependent pyruvate/acetoin dehydrogenase alpha subunit
VRPHEEGLPDIKGTGIRSKQEIEPWLQRDPIKLSREQLLKDAVLTQEDIDEINREADEEMKDAEAFATESKPANPESLEKVLYAE